MTKIKRVAQPNKEEEMSVWTASPVAVNGDKVKLLHTLRVWQYAEGESKKSPFRHWDTNAREVSIGAIGTVLDRYAWAGHISYSVKFGDIVVEHIKEFYLENVTDEQKRG